jgi:hypothetical protein
MRPSWMLRGTRREAFFAGASGGKYIAKVDGGVVVEEEEECGEVSTSKAGQGPVEEVEVRGWVRGLVR